MIMNLALIIKKQLIKILPKSVYDLIFGLYIKLIRFKVKKYDAELAFWKSRLEIDNGTFSNKHYRKIMLAMAERDNQDFITDKIIADFGCGPRGSLFWADNASVRIGIDVLSDIYADNFKSNIINHNMIYLKSTENVIPLPSEYCDIIFSLNAIDHVDNYQLMSNEIFRILKTGGEFIASFNIEEPETICEPQCLSENDVKEMFLGKLELISYRISEKGPSNDNYAPFFSGHLNYQKGQEGYLWIRAVKK